MKDSLIELITPRMTPSHRSFFRLGDVPLEDSTHRVDISETLEELYAIPSHWVKELSEVGWKLPSVKDYHAVFSFIYANRKNSKFEETINSLRETFARNEFCYSSPKLATSTYAFYNQSQLQEPAIPNLPAFTPGGIGEYADHEAFLNALLGTRDVDNVAAIWNYVSSQEIRLLSRPNIAYGNPIVSVILGSCLRSSGVGITIDNHPATMSARPFRMDSYE